LFAVWQVLTEEGVRHPQELKTAMALFGAVKEEGFTHPTDLQSAVSIFAIVRDEMGDVEPQEVRRVLRGTRIAPPSARQHALPNGSSLESGGSSPELEDLRQQLATEKAARQRYAKKLEDQALEWMEQVRVLKGTIDSLRAKLPAGGHGVPGGMGGVGSTGSGSASPMAGIRGTHGMNIGTLYGELDAKGPLFEDDANFILEVASGAAYAPDMDAQAELDRLRRKHELWNKDFKDKLRAAQAGLRKSQSSKGPPGPPGSVDVNTMPDLASAHIWQDLDGGMEGVPEGGRVAKLGGVSGPEKKAKGGLFKSFLS
jgi:hypothetical protein